LQTSGSPTAIDLRGGKETADAFTSGWITNPWHAPGSTQKLVPFIDRAV
jgi:hypothetical protein